jgi:hypothetical protein
LIEPLSEVVRELDRFEIPHMLAGSFASSYHGEPRTTRDIDLVIDPSESALQDLVRNLAPERFYVSEAAAQEAWLLRSQFNLVHLETGWKIDLILRKDRAFSREEFTRRERAEIGGTTVFVASAEDTVLAKLEWARAGESERQVRDVIGVLQMRGDELDRGYIERWVDELGLADLWNRARLAAEGN